MADLSQFREALARLQPEHFLGDGRPDSRDLNAALEALGHPEVTAAERDDLWARHAVEPTEPTTLDGTPLEDPPDGMIVVRVERSMTNPLPLYVHGVGAFRLPVDVETRIPAEALDALRSTDATFTVIEE